MAELQERQNLVKYLLSLSEHKLIIALLLLAVIWLAGDKQYSDYRNESRIKENSREWQRRLDSCQAKNDRITDEAERVILNFYEKSNEADLRIQRETDSISREVRKIKKVNKNMFKLFDK